MGTERDSTHNYGLISALDVPDDKYIVGAYIALVDDDGEYHVYCKQDGFFRMPNGPDTEHPIPEVQIEIASVIATAYKIANL